MRTVLLAAVLAVAMPAYAGDGQAFDGVWEGQLTFLPGAGTPAKVSPPEGMALRIEIRGQSAHVYYGRAADRMQEVKPGEFHVVPYMTNAVVFASDSGNDEEGTWVETWNFTLTLKDANAMLADYSRVVNNLALPLSSDHSKFAVQAYGELKRTSP